MVATSSQMSAVLIQQMGGDLSVVNAARVSFAKQSFSVTEADKKLIRYLAKHNHWTPFGHASATFLIKAPIFVARQLVKHQVGLVWNEVSRRYVDDEPEFWLPETVRGRAANVKQGSDDNLSPATQDDARRAIETATQASLESYRELLRAGVAPEQARMVLPQNTLTEWWWTGSLAAWARVCQLRLDPHAQAETSEVALLISEQMGKAFPVSWSALMDDQQTIVDVAIHKDGTREVHIP